MIDSLRLSRGIGRWFVLLAAIVTIPSRQAASSSVAPFSEQGVIRLAGHQVSMNSNGAIEWIDANGRRYDIHLSLTTKAEPNRWFSASGLTQRQVSVDASARKVTCRGQIVSGSQAPIPLEYSLSLTADQRPRISLSYLTQEPIQNRLSLANVHIHTARAPWAGKTIAVGSGSFPIVADQPPGTKSNYLFSGPSDQVIYGDDDPASSTRVQVIQATRVTLNDLNVTTRSPIVEIRLEPKNNQVVFELEMPAVQAPPSEETYAGVDFWASDRLRMPPWNACRNLVQNPGFDQGLDSWQWDSYGSMTQNRLGDYFLVDVTQAHQGSSSLKILGESGQSPAALSTFAIPCEPGQSYTLSFYAKADRDGRLLQVRICTASMSQFALNRSLTLSTSWQRYSVSFTSPNGLLLPTFAIHNPPEDGAAWLDAVQLEKGPLTDYVQNPAGVTLQTAHRDRCFQLGQATAASFRITGPASASGELFWTAKDFFGQTWNQGHQLLTFDAQGQAIVAAPWADQCPGGLNVIETELKLADGWTRRDFHRLAFMTFLQNDYRHKNSFSNGFYDYRYGSWTRRLAYWTRMGLGSQIYDYYRGVPDDYLTIARSLGILNADAISKSQGPELIDNLIRQFHLDSAQLTQLEDQVAQRVSANPQIKYWKLLNEPGWSYTDNLQEMNLLVRTLAAAARGIRRGNPQAIVISPDPSNMYPGAGIRWMDHFMTAYDQYVQETGQPFLDIVAIHPYRPRPEEPDLDSDTDSLLTMLDSHGFQGDVWFTEGMLYPRYHLPAYQSMVFHFANVIDSCRIGSLSYDLGLGERISAAYTARSRIIALKHGQRVKMFCDEAVPLTFLCDYDMTPAAATYAHNTVAGLLGNADYRQDIALGSHFRCCVFEDDARRPIAAIWNHDLATEMGNGTPAFLNLQPLGEGMEMIDFMGRRWPLTGSPASVPLEPYPLFVRGPQGSLADFVQRLSQCWVTGSDVVPWTISAGLTSDRQATLSIRNAMSKPWRGRLSIAGQPTPADGHDVALTAAQKLEIPVTLPWNGPGLHQQELTVSWQESGQTAWQRSTIRLTGLAIPWLNPPIVIDGQLDDWPSQAGFDWPVEQRVEFDRQAKAWGGPSDLSARLFLAWDAQFLYLALKVKDDVHAVVDDPAKAFQGDSIQLYLDGWADASVRQHKGFANDDQAMMIWAGASGLRIQRTLAPEYQLAFLKTGPVTGAKGAFQRTPDGQSIYEIALPLADIQPVALKPASRFGLALLLNDRDADRRRRRGLTLTPVGTEPHERPDLYPQAILVQRP